MIQRLCGLDNQEEVRLLFLGIVKELRRFALEREEGIEFYSW